MKRHLAGRFTMQADHPLQPLPQRYQVVLGSKSPRRVEFLRGIGLDFTTRPSNAEETIPPDTPLDEIPLLLALQKRSALLTTMTKDELLITADTVVIQGAQLIGKPKDPQEAKDYIRNLSGSWHRVLTGYTIGTKSEIYKAETVESRIRFAPLHADEIEYYTTHYEVLDKAGAYGIQDWIGLIAVEEIQGSYTNVMGLPTESLYKSLREIAAQI